MVKKHNNKKQIFKFKKSHILWVIIVGLAITQSLSLWKIVQLENYLKSDSDFQMRVLLKEAEEERYKHPLIDISENKVYIPEIRIYLPLNDTTRDVRYDYRTPPVGFGPEIIYFSMSSIVGRQGDAEYASCDKMVAITAPDKAQAYGMGTPIATIQPTKYGFSDIFIYSDESCWDQEWYSNLQQKLLESVKQAKNY